MEHKHLWILYLVTAAICALWFVLTFIDGIRSHSFASALNIILLLVQAAIIAWTGYETAKELNRVRSAESGDTADASSKAGTSEQSK